jgi:F-box protein 9
LCSWPIYNRVCRQYYAGLPTMPDQDVDTIDELTVDTTIEQPDYTAVSTSPTEDELERFREEWQKELQQRKRQDPGIQIQQTAQQRLSGSLPTGSLASNNAAGTAARTQGKDRGRTSDFDRDIKHDPPLPRKSPSTSPKLSQRLPKSPTKSAAQIEPVGGHSPSANATSSSSKTVKEVKGKRAQKVAQAVEQYANAVELEQMGRLNEALQLYRGAYRLDRQSTSPFSFPHRPGPLAERPDYLLP